MLCGISSFHSVDETPTSPSTPKGSKKKHGGGGSDSSGGNYKNPYASRGLEKFTSVISELEAKKEKLMGRRVSDSGGDVPMASIKCSNARDLIPIVVQLKEEASNDSSPASPKPKPWSPKSWSSKPWSPRLGSPKPGSPKPGSLKPGSPIPGSPKVMEEVKAAGVKVALPEKKIRKHVTWNLGEDKRVEVLG